MPHAAAVTAGSAKELQLMLHSQEALLCPTLNRQLQECQLTHHSRKSQQRKVQQAAQGSTRRLAAHSRLA
jgi:hypothetical protein